MENVIDALEAIPTDELLKLENQLCFPLYACSRQVVRRYTPFLDKLGLTYTQYLVLMCLWEYGDQSVGALCERLYLDTGTLTPLLKKLEQKNLVTRTRSDADGRRVDIALTEAGATFPYGNDPLDSNIRIAPTYPTLEDLKTAAKVLALCTKLVSVEKLLAQKAE